MLNRMQIAFFEMMTCSISMTIMYFRLVLSVIFFIHFLFFVCFKSLFTFDFKCFIFIFVICCYFYMLFNYWDVL